MNDLVSAPLLKVSENTREFYLSALAAVSGITTSTGMLPNSHICPPASMAAKPRIGHLGFLSRGANMVAYLSILATAVAAFFGAPVWAMLPGAAVLTAISLREHRQLSTRFAAINASHVLHMANWQSAGDALLASGAAWLMGAVPYFLLH